ncbi:MAG: ComEC/Rec2 family competence protein [Burkholderiaceae bacterium]
MLPVTLLDPWALLQPGFWLSFAAVGLLMVSAPARATRRPWARSRRWPWVTRRRSRPRAGRSSATPGSRT